MTLIIMDHLIMARRPNLVLINKKNPILETTVLIKESKKNILARELRKLWTMRMTVIPIVVGALEMVLKGKEKLEISGRIKITAFLS